MFEVEVKQVDELHYASQTHNTLASSLDALITATIGELAAGGIDGPPFVIYHGLVNEEDDGPVEIGVPRASGDRVLAGGEVAFAKIDDSTAAFPEILGAYDAIARWAKQHGREFAGRPREVYLSDVGAPVDWEVVWPLR